MRNEDAGEKKKSKSSFIETVTCSCLVNVLNYNSYRH